MNIKTNELLSTLRQTVEKHIEMAKKMQEMSQDKLNAQPAPSKWSALQCLEHLNMYGRYYISAIQQAIEKSKAKGWEAKENYRSGWLGNYFANAMQPDMMSGMAKTTMKAMDNYIPPTALNAIEVMTEFLAHQRQIHSLLNAAAQANLQKSRVPTTLSKWLTIQLGDTFRFVIAHNERHLQQALRALK